MSDNSTNYLCSDCDHCYSVRFGEVIRCPRCASKERIRPDDPDGILACEHGRQRRKCPICLRDAELAETRATRDSALATVATLTGERDGLHKANVLLNKGFESSEEERMEWKLKCRKAESTVAEMKEELAGVRQRLGEAVGLIRAARSGTCIHTCTCVCRTCQSYLAIKADDFLANHDAGISKSEPPAQAIPNKTEGQT